MLNIHIKNINQINPDNAAGIDRRSLQMGNMSFCIQVNDKYQEKTAGVIPAKGRESDVSNWVLTILRRYYYFIRRETPKTFRKSPVTFRDFTNNIWDNNLSYRTYPKIFWGFPVSRRDFPEMFRDSPVRFRDFPVKCRSFPALEREFPALCRGSPVLCRGSPMNCRGFPGSYREFPALRGGFPGSYGEFPAE